MLFSSVLAVAPPTPMPVAHKPGGDFLGYPPSLSSEKHSPVFMSSMQWQQGPPSQYYDGKDGTVVVRAVCRDCGYARPHQ